MDFGTPQAFGFIYCIHMPTHRSSESSQGYYNKV